MVGYPFKGKTTFWIRLWKDGSVFQKESLCGVCEASMRQAGLCVWQVLGLRPSLASFCSQVVYYTDGHLNLGIK